MCATTKEERVWLHKIGICVTCKTRSVETGYKQCSLCKVKGFRRNKKWRKEHKNERRAYNQELRLKRLANGLCSECNKPRCSQSKRFCLEHYVRNKKQSSAAWRKKKAERTTEEECAIQEKKIAVAIKNLEKARQKAHLAKRTFERENELHFYESKERRAVRECMKRA